MTMPEMVNAVLVRYTRGMIWRTDGPSIALYGRVEDFLSVETENVAIAEQLGDEYLRTRSRPQLTHVVEVSPAGPQYGADFVMGQTLQAGADTELLCVGVTFGLEDDGTWRAVPELSTPLEEATRQSDRVFDRIVAAAGGVGRASAPPIDTGSGVPTGRLGSINIPSWSWSSSDELDDQWEPGVDPGDGGQFGQPHEMDEPGRLYEWVIKAKIVDNDGDNFTFGPSEFELTIGGAPISPPFIITVPDTGEDSEGYVTARQDIFGPALLLKGTVIAPVCRTNGGHEGGSINVRATDPT